MHKPIIYLILLQHIHYKLHRSFGVIIFNKWRMPISSWTFNELLFNIYWPNFLCIGQEDFLTSSYREKGTWVEKVRSLLTPHNFKELSIFIRSWRTLVQIWDIRPKLTLSHQNKNHLELKCYKGQSSHAKHIWVSWGISPC